MKNCSKCNIPQPLTEFGVKKSDGLYNSWCKACVRLAAKLYKRTHQGLIQCIYANQIRSSKRRNHPKPTYTKAWLQNFILTQPHFEKLYRIWVNSNYARNTVPSIDRLDDNAPYSENNIQLLSWEQNNEKGKTCYLEGKLGKKVTQYSLDERPIKDYPNMSSAAKAVGCTIGEISRVCYGKRNTCRGYKWSF